MIDICCFYADLGYPYLSHMETMTKSAKVAMPNARTVLLTPTPSIELRQLFDKTIDISVAMKTTQETICYDRARATVSWAANTKNSTIYSDPDIEFNREIEFDGSFEVGLLWRPRKPDQPINTGLVLSEAGCKEFWGRYGAIIANLPSSLHGWWCDQIGFNIMLGTLHKAGDVVQAHDARVKLFPMNEYCAPREKTTTDNPWAWHNKGRRKWTQGSKAA